MQPIQSPVLSRVEDHRLVTGNGQYLADIPCDKLCHAAFVRSPHAHANILAIDLEDARQMRGVIAVFSGSELPMAMPAVNPLIDDLNLPVCEAMASKTVHWLGQAVAIVVAQTQAQADQASATIWPDYETIDINPDEHKPLASLNISRGDLPKNGHLAAITVTAKISQPRVSAMPLETRGALAHWQQDVQRLDVWLPTQAPSRARNDIAAALNLDNASVRVRTPDVGGAFGAKASIYPEDLIIAAVAKRINRPLRWLASRSEDLLSASHGRGARLSAELAVDRHGKLLALSANLQFSMGGCLAFSTVVPARNAARILPGPYRIPATHVQARLHMDHGAPINIYRGAGRPEAAILLERLIDDAARASQQDALAFRQKNLLKPADMPATLPSGDKIDSGDFPATLACAAEAFAYQDKLIDVQRRRAAGDCVGLGIGFYVEPCGSGFERARLTWRDDGGFDLATGSSSQGQGHQTSHAQIAAAALDCDPAEIRVIEGDTDRCPDGIGALASRTTAIGGSAIHLAANRLAQRIRDGESAPISETERHDAIGEAWSHGCVMALVAIDQQTGVMTVEQIAWADDAGNIINPQLVKGQLLGGLAQGFGQAMMERIVYDRHGQLLTGTLMDYAVPRADQMPPVTLKNLCSPSPVNPLGAKGVGEAGCIGVPAALLNACRDALHGISPLPHDMNIDFPLSAETIWRAIKQLKEPS